MNLKVNGEIPIQPYERNMDNRIMNSSDEVELGNATPTAAL